MKLLRLKIGEKFRSLPANFELHFLRQWEQFDYNDIKNMEFSPYVLSGLNGSGKSNALEVLAAIFYHVECQYLTNRPDSFDFDEQDHPTGFRGEVSKPNSFELEYVFLVPEEYKENNVTDVAHIKIVKKSKQRAEIFWLNHSKFGEEKPLERIDAWKVLPDFVLGYSSGENEILSLPFFKMRFIQLDEYLSRLIDENPYENKPESRHIYLDREFNQAILICNFLFENESTLQPFKEEVGIEHLSQFRIIIRKYKNAYQDSEQPDDSSFLSLDQILEKKSKNPVVLTSLLEIKEHELYDKEIRNEGIINKLQSCATCSYFDEVTNSLYLDYWVTEATKQAFKHNFGEALTLFQSLRILLILNLYSVSEQLKFELYQSDSLYVNETVPILPSDQRIMRFKNLELKKKGIENPISIKSLSDGEHQFLHSIGLCLLFKNKNCLFLLDEPETHFNPYWRSKFISCLRDCFKEDDEKENKKIMREMLITTHTPFLISDSKPEHVLVFSKDDKGQVQVNRPDYNTLGASVDQITMLTFNKAETIGGYAEQKIKSIQERFENGEDKHKLINETNKQLGDSIEKMLLIRTIRDGINKKGS